MKEKDDDIAHPDMVSKPKKHLILAQFSNSPWTETYPWADQMKTYRLLKFLGASEASLGQHAKKGE